MSSRFIYLHSHCGDGFQVCGRNSVVCHFNETSLVVLFVLQNNMGIFSAFHNLSADCLARWNVGWP